MKERQMKKKKTLTRTQEINNAFCEASINSHKKVIDSYFNAYDPKEIMKNIKK